MVFAIIDWFMDNLLFFWLVIAMFFLFLEMGSPGLFFFLSFFLGALMCAVSTFITDSLTIQSLIFLVGTVISFLFLHFWVKAKISKIGTHEHSNIYALIGKVATVMKPIVPGSYGRVKILGDVWLARTLDDDIINEGQQVKIIKVQGAHLVVEKFIKQ